MGKIQYLVNGKPVSKVYFYKRLKSHCFKVVRTYSVAGYGISVEDFDSSKFKSYCRKLNGYDIYGPFTVIFLNPHETFKIVK